jgi:hypothetical protein
MTTLKLSPLALLCLISVTTLADGNSNSPLVQNEYAKAQTQLESKLLTAMRALKGFDDARLKAIEDAKAMSDVDMEGLRGLKRYYTLLLGRYSNDAAQFQPWTVLANDDRENINKLFDTYLHSKPLHNRVSAGQAERTLDWGMSRLEEIYKMHKSPSPENNSDLEILSHQIKDSEASVKAIKTHADRLDIKLNEKAIQEAVNNPSAGDEGVTGRIPTTE